MEDTQLMKGILEGCVLAVIAKKETYGYEILTCMEQVGFDNLGEGTLYPVLTRLDKNGYISSRFRRNFIVYFFRFLCYDNPDKSLEESP